MTIDASTSAYLEEFIQGFLECALWSSCDPDTEGNPPLDDTFDIDDFDAKTLEELTSDCADFVSSNGEALEASGLDASQAGHDFWLTRNRHGAGFWDRGLGELGERLTKAAHVYGGVDLIPCDGKVCS